MSNEKAKHDWHRQQSCSMRFRQGLFVFYLQLDKNARCTFFELLPIVICGRQLVLLMEMAYTFQINIHKRKCVRATANVALRLHATCLKFFLLLPQVICLFTYLCGGRGEVCFLSLCLGGFVVFLFLFFPFF